MALCLPPQVGMPLLAAAAFAKFSDIAGRCMFAATIETLDISPHLKDNLINGYTAVTKAEKLVGLGGSVANLANLPPEKLWETIALMRIKLRSGLEAFPKASASFSAMESFFASLPPFDAQAVSAWQQAGEAFTQCDVGAADRELLDAQYLGLLGLQSLDGELASAETEMACAMRDLRKRYGAEVEFILSLDPQAGGVARQTYAHYNAKRGRLQARHAELLGVMGRMVNQCETLRRFNASLEERKQEYVAARNALEGALAARTCNLTAARAALGRLSELDKGNCAVHFPEPHSDVYAARLDVLAAECTRSEPPPIGPSAIWWKRMEGIPNPDKHPELSTNGQPPTGNYIEDRRSFGLTSYSRETSWSPGGKLYSRWKFTCTFDQPPDAIVPNRAVPLNTSTKAEWLQNDPQGINHGVGYAFEGVSPTGTDCRTTAGKLRDTYVPSDSKTCQFVFPETSPDEFVIYVFGSGYGKITEWRYKKQVAGRK